jgi:hypothetical protein
MGQEEQGLGGAANMPPFGRESMERDDDDLAFESDLDEDEPPLRYARRPREGPRERINQGMRDIAERIQLAAERLDEMAEEHLVDASGPLARAGTAAQEVAGRMEAVADYLYSSDVDTVRRGVERQVREKPLQSVLIAVAAGWIAGKILR